MRTSRLGGVTLVPKWTATGCFMVPGSGKPNARYGTRTISGEVSKTGKMTCARSIASENAQSTICSTLTANVCLFRSGPDRTLAPSFILSVALQFRSDAFAERKAQKPRKTSRLLCQNIRGIRADEKRPSALSAPSGGLLMRAFHYAIRWICCGQSVLLRFGARLCLQTCTPYSQSRHM